MRTLVKVILSVSIIINIILSIYIYTTLYNKTKVITSNTIPANTATVIQIKPTVEVATSKDTKIAVRVEIDPFSIYESQDGDFTVQETVKGRVFVNEELFKMALRLDPSLVLSTPRLPFRIGLYIPLTANGPTEGKYGALTALYRVRIPWIDQKWHIGVGFLGYYLTKPWDVTRNTSIDIGIGRDWRGNTQGVIGVSIRL